MLAHVAGAELSDRVDMIAPVAATVGREILDLVPKRPVEAFIVHGAGDRLVPYLSRGDDRFLPAVEAERYWARANGCSTVEGEETSDAIIKRYGGGACRVTSIIVKNAGHVWPGGKARMGGEHDPKTIDATALILERFLSND
jgi:poly(3-hydroxybutyrate) depolymerase